MAPEVRDGEVDYFSVMGLTPSASEADIRRAHKKLSLALHPDKNRDMDAVVAAARFSEMQLAYEVLMDPSARLAAAKRAEEEAARRARRGAYEGKRKAMAEELERREEEDRQKRYRAVQDERKRNATLQRLREEGRRLREEREERVNAQRSDLQEQKEAGLQASADNPLRESHHMPEKSPEPELGPLDLTVKLRFPGGMYAELSASKSDTADKGKNCAGQKDCALARGLAARFGTVDSIIFRPYKPGKREATAHATFTAIEAAHAAVEAGGKMNAGGFGDARVLEDVWIGWASSTEPECVTWRRRHGKLAQAELAQSRYETNGKIGSEADILKKLRQSTQNGKKNDTSLENSSKESSPFPSFSFKASPQPSPALQASKPANAIKSSESDILLRMRQAGRSNGSS